ncbi:MAG: PIN domain-containing protein [Desulfomonilia bacterium]
MHSTAVRADCFDASALVKVFTDEPDSDAVCDYFNSCPTKYTTPFCFYEAMNILKSKWKYQSKLDIDGYLEASFKLTAWYGASAAHVHDLDFTDPATFASARRLVLATGLDLSDAFQIVSVKQGYFSSLINDSSTVLVTADKLLARVAKSEGLRVWSVSEEHAP